MEAGRGRVGPYELREELGRGGMGSVHRAVDSRTGEEVALELEPGQANALWHRGRVKLQLGDDPGAIADLEAALRLAGDAPWAGEARSALAAARGGR